MASQYPTGQGVITAGRQLVPATPIMQQLNFRNRTAFWSFVHQQGLPHIRLTPRKIVFDPAAVDAWLAGRVTGGVAR